MAGTALVIGGSGQIGRAVCAALVADGWEVVAAQRHPFDSGPGVRALTIDREQAGAITQAVGGGVDALIDTVAYDETHARQLLEIQASVGSLVVISSASVYRDAKGRSLDEAADTGFPRLPDPIGEDQPTVAPGPQTYSTRKVALEQTLLQNAVRPVTILRPCAIHGPGSRHPREWFFVKRILDKRRAVPLAYDGQSRFHTSATANIAELVRVALAAPETRVLNAADPRALSVTAIGEVIAGLYGHQWRLVPFSGHPADRVGASPWGVPHALVVDMTRAASLGYRPVATYEAAIGAACRSAETTANSGVAFPPYLLAMFDYASEDRFLGRARRRNQFDGYALRPGR